MASWKDRWLWISLGVTVVTLGVAWGIQEPCLRNPWDGYQYENYCYSDILPLYHMRGLDEGRVPYVEEMNEYPVLSGLVMWGAAKVTDDGAGFYTANAVVLAIFALMTTVGVWAVVEDKRRTLLWAAAPSLALLAFNNWDVLAAGFMMLALWAHQKGRPLATGVLLGLGTAAKLYPGLLLPMLGLEILRQEAVPGAWRPRSWRWHPRTWPLGPASWRFGLGAVGTLAALHVPLLLIDRATFLEGIRFQLDRGPSLESLWLLLSTYGERWGWDWLVTLMGPEVLPTLTKLVFVGVLVLLGVGVWKRRVGGMAAGFGAVLAMLLFNQVYSTQYVVWVLPFLAALPVSARQVVLVWVADVLFHLAFFTWLLEGGQDLFGQQGRPAYEQVGLAIVLRTVAYGWLLRDVLWAALGRPVARIGRTAFSAEGAPVQQGPPVPAEAPASAERS